MQTKYTESVLTEDRSMRDGLMDRMDVLDKVKALLLLPHLEMYTMQQIADYYEVGMEAVKKCVQRNRAELNEDGVTLTKMEFWKGQFVPSKDAIPTRGIVEYQLDETTTLRVPNAGMLLFPKRAVLRIGMLLRDSTIAREVRTQLLNVFEKTEAVMPDVIVEDVEDEQALLMNVASAYASGDISELFKATALYNAFQKRHIARLEDDKKLLTASILEWTDRSALNKVVRVLAGRMECSFAHLWNLLYDELMYKHHISLRQRGGSPYIQHIHEDEWPLVQQSLAAICEDNGISIASIREYLDRIG